MVDKVRVSNLILVDHAGTVIEGDHVVNRAGFVLHANVHEAQPDIAATGLAPIRIPDDRARYSLEHVGSDYIGGLHFRTLWNQLVQDCPDMLD